MEYLLLVFILVLILIVVIRLMKLNHFYGSISIKERNGYTETLQFSTNGDNDLRFIYPYGEITPEEVAAVSKFAETITDAYNKLQATIDGVNVDLLLEQYAPKLIGSDLYTDAEVSAESAVAQPARGGGEEVLTGADRDIDKPQLEIVTDKDMFGQ